MNTSTAVLDRPLALPKDAVALTVPPIALDGLGSIQSFNSSQLATDPFVGAEAVLAVAMQPVSAEVAQSTEATGSRSFKIMGRVLVAEAFGLGLDGLRIGLGVPVEAAEPLLSAIDGVIIGRAVDGSHAAKAPETLSRKRRVGSFLGHAVTNATLAIAAQRGGMAFVDGVAPALSHGVGEFAVPIISKASVLIGSKLGFSKIRNLRR